MNRSFRAQDSQKMQGAMKQRQQQGKLMSSVTKEKEEELALFLDMRKREKDRNHHLLQNSEEFDASFASKPGSSTILNISSSTPAPTKKTRAGDFLNSDNDKNDYDWLLTPPGTPLFPSLESETRKTIMSQIGTPKARPTSLNSRLVNPQPETITRSNIASNQYIRSPGLNSSSSTIRRPSSSNGIGSRPTTPTGRPTLNPTPKPSRPSTPTSRPTLPSTRPTGPTRSTTPLTRVTSRSSTPTGRPSLLAASTKPTSRTATPTRRPSMPSNTSNVSSGPLARSTSSVPKPAPISSKNPTQSRGSSPTVKSRPWKPMEMPDFSHEAPPNLRTSLPERPLSASRGRPGAPSLRSSSIEPSPNGRPRRQSCSPSRGRPPNGVGHMSGSSVPVIVSRHSKVNDNVSPGVMGTKMVERVINMRKLIPPKQDIKNSPSLSGKSASSPDSSGFGRNLSKKSLDMAIRHMDIRRTTPGSLRPLMTNIPASSLYSVRSGPPRSRIVSVSDSPLATSSNASSEISVNNNGLCFDGSELDDDIVSERSVRSHATTSSRHLRGR